MFQLTKAYLESISTKQSYARGMSYYLIGEVLNVVQKGDTFEAKVSGSVTYKVSITLNDKGMSASNCTCPYDWGGVCKHIVAVGLAIANNDFEKDNNYISSERFFKQLYPYISDEQKIAFLTEILQNDGFKRSEILKFAGIKGGRIPASLIGEANGNIDIDDLATQIGAEIYDMASSYKDIEDDDEEENAETLDSEIADTINEYFTTYNPQLNNLHFVNGFKAMIAIYESPYCIPNIRTLSAYNNEIINYNTSEIIASIWADQLPDLILNAPKTEQDLIQCCDILAERLEKRRHEVKHYHLDNWLPVIEALLPEAHTAAYLLEAIRRRNLDGSNAANLLLLLSDLSGQLDYWLQIAEREASTNINIALRLFDRYLSTQARDKQLRIAQLLFDKFPQKSAEHLLPHLSPHDNRKLFLSVAGYLAAQHHDLRGYQELCQWWTPNERDQFVAAQRAQPVFYMQLRLLRDEYDQALKYLQNNHSSPQFVDMMELLADHFPLEIIELLHQKINKALISSGASRNTYKMIADWCRPLSKISTERQAVAEFIHRLVHIEYKRMPALKEELKQAGVIAV